MTQQQLADLCGVSRQTINAIERNKHPPSLELAFKIARVFGIAIEDIFLYEPDPEGGNPYKDGVIIEVTFEDPSGGNMDSDGEGMKSARHYERSAVVTRRPASVMTQAPADFCKCRSSDAVCKCLKLGDEKPLHLTVGLSSGRACTVLLASYALSAATAETVARRARDL
jgi:putative transcriptional regulator